MKRSRLGEIDETIGSRSRLRPWTTARTRRRRTEKRAEAHHGSPVLK
jgi:hypothetical protein